MKRVETKKPIPKGVSPMPTEDNKFLLRPDEGKVIQVLQELGSELLPSSFPYCKERAIKTLKKRWTAILVVLTD